MKKITTLLLIVFLIPFMAKAQCFSAIEAGQDFTVAIKTNGTLVAWGKNDQGQLGDGTTTNKNIPTQIGTASNWAKISVGQDHTLAIKTDGTLWAWGNNSFQKLGFASSGSVSVPTQIGIATNWDFISAGGGHSVAIKTDGTLWAWGRNFYGQLGDGTNTNRSIPTQIGSATDWKSISAGNEHTMARRNGSTLWVWGSNLSGELGDGTTVSKNTPFEIGVGANNWLKIYAGTSSSMAIKSNGTLWAWGNNGYGNLGTGSTANLSIPTQIGTATNWSTISLGFGHVLAIKTDFTLYAWGWNADGQLGDGTTVNKLVPYYLSTTNTALIAAGVYHSICTISSGTGLIYTWGNNQKGQIGDGTFASTGTPVNPTAINCPATLANETFDSSIVSLYPNPSNGNFRINTNESIKKCTAYDILGKETKVETISENQFYINNKGIYFLKIEFENETTSNQKIIIKL